MAQNEENVVELRPYRDARVLWPPDMTDDLLEFAVETAKDSKRQFDIDSQGQEVARYIKQKFDEKWLPYWHVVVGKSFGSHCTHESERFVYFYLEKHAFMIYKIGY